MEIREDFDAIHVDNLALLHGKYERGERLLESISQFSKISGIQKLERRITSELRFLEKLKSSPHMKKEHIHSSNIVSLAAIVDILTNCQIPIAVLQPFSVENGNSRIEVDVIGDGGSTWYKAVARNAEAISQICKGKSGGSQRSVIDQAKCYLKCAKDHPFHFNAPQVIFCFANNVSRTLAAELNQLGIHVEGELIDLEESSEEEDSDSSDDYDSDSDSSDDDDNDCCGSIECDTLPNQIEDQHVSSGLNKLFLDITCMVAYVSSMTNGGANYIFPRDIYNLQAKWERASPAKSNLDVLFDGKELVTCREAFKDFQMLVDKMGGSGEKQRAKEFMQRVQVVDDSPSQRVSNLKLSSNIKQRSRIIFGTADHLRSIIVTANTGFIRSAEGQGVSIAAYIHEARVLTEQQQILATPLNSSDLSNV